MGTERVHLACALAILIAGTAVPVAAEDQAAVKDLPGVYNGVGIEEHLGSTIPLDATFRGEDGAPVVLRDLVRSICREGGPDHREGPAGLLQL
jgi:hypothetical protein